MTSIEALIMQDAKGDQIQFEIPGEPVAQMRPRVAYALRKVYNPQRKSILKLRTKLREALDKVGKDNPYPFFAAGKKLTLAITFNVTQQSKDIDNMLKYYMDVMHQVVYANDVQVFNVSMRKRVNASNVGTKIDIIYRHGS